MGKNVKASLVGFKEAKNIDSCRQMLEKSQFQETTPSKEAYYESSDLSR